ncbi:MAG: AMP-binding protein [Granulosicoccus sp.]
MRNHTYDPTNHYNDFTWKIPECYNIGVDICDKWATKQPKRTAIIDVSTDSQCREYSFSDLMLGASQLAHALTSLGIQPAQCQGAVGDRVGILLPQCAQTAISHIAVLRMGCVSLPLFTLFGEQALLHRLRDSEAKAVITNSEGAQKIGKIRSQLPKLEHIISIDAFTGDALDFTTICDRQAEFFKPALTKPDDPALLIYTSGTTGDPKGALHAHRVLPGHLPGVEISHNFLPATGDRFWTPADWAWIGGLLDVLMPALHHGIPVVAYRFTKFDAKAAFDLMKKHQINNVFLPPTAIKLMKQWPDARQQGIRLRSVGSGGETLGSELLAWGQEAFATTINEFYGQTECNMVISACAALEPPVPGSMGRAVPGHEVQIVDPRTGVVQEPNVEGTIAIKAPDPVMFLGYWNNHKASEAKFVDGPDGRWLLTGDRGKRDTSGHFFFIGRDDDVINSAGYRIGPAEIENCLIGHEAVSLAGVVGQPDELRGEIVTAFLTLKAGFVPGESLANDIASFVKSRLAAHEYPRAIHFIDSMPMTTTGKIIRARLREWVLESSVNAPIR